MKTSASDFQATGCRPNEVQMECIAREIIRGSGLTLDGKNKNELCATWHAKTGGSSCVSGHHEGELVNCILQDKCAKGNSPPPTTRICGESHPGCPDARAQQCEDAVGVGTDGQWLTDWRSECCRRVCSGGDAPPSDFGEPEESTFCTVDHAYLNGKPVTPYLLDHQLDKTQAKTYGECVQSLPIGKDYDEEQWAGLHTQYQDCCKKAIQPDAQERCNGSWSDWMSHKGWRADPGAAVPCAGACSEWFSGSFASLMVPSPRGNFVDIGLKWDGENDFLDSAWDLMHARGMTKLLLQDPPATEPYALPSPWAWWRHDSEQICTTHPLSSIYGTQHSEWRLTDPDAKTSKDECHTHTAKICIMNETEREGWCSGIGAEAEKIEDFEEPRDWQVHCQLVADAFESTFRRSLGNPEAVGCSGEMRDWLDAENAPSGGGCGGAGSR
jgi:hypothetical protein